MTCDDFRKLISAARDNELNEPDRQKLNEHMQSCAACREYAEEINSIGNALRQWPPAPCPPEVEKTIVEKVGSLNQSAAGSKSHWGGYYRIPRGLVWAACLVMAFLIIQVTVHPFDHKGDELSPSIPSESTTYVQKIVFSEYDVVYTTPVTNKHMNN